MVGFLLIFCSQRQRARFATTKLSLAFVWIPWDFVANRVLGNFERSILWKFDMAIWYVLPKACHKHCWTSQTILHVYTYSYIYIYIYIHTHINTRTRYFTRESVNANAYVWWELCCSWLNFRMDLQWGYSSSCAAGGSFRCISRGTSPEAREGSGTSQALPKTHTSSHHIIIIIYLSMHQPNSWRKKHPWDFSGNDSFSHNHGSGKYGDSGRKSMQLGLVEFAGWGTLPTPISLDFWVNRPWPAVKLALRSVRASHVFLCV